MKKYTESYAQNLGAIPDRLTQVAIDEMNVSDMPFAAAALLERMTDEELKLTVNRLSAAEYARLTLQVVTRDAISVAQMAGGAAFALRTGQQMK